MGYTTDFSGTFDLSRKLTKNEAEYLKLFASSRHMTRDPIKIKNLCRGERNEACFDLLEKLNLDVGPKGEHYFGSGNFGQGRDASIVDYNESDPCPSLWCQWVPTRELDGLEWDQGEKFYESDKWIKFLIVHFLAPWGITVNGTVEWQGEDPVDMGRLTVKDNEVYIEEARVSYKKARKI